jgi:hypothetical protein
MAAILSYVRNPIVFEPEATRAMSVAFDEVCRALNVSPTANGAREVIATRNRVGAARRMRPRPAPRPSDHRGGRNQCNGSRSRG